MESWANNYIGIPYLFGGSTREGCDCWGLVRMILREQYKKELPEVPHYDSCPMRLSEAVNDTMNIATNVIKPKTGCLVLLKIMGYPSHIGVYVGGGYMIHSLCKHDSILERIDRGRWLHRVEGFYDVN